MQACCIPVTNGVRSICVGCRWVVKGRQNFHVHKSLRLALATPFAVLRKIMFNNGTDLTARIDKNYQNGFTTTLDFPKIEAKSKNRKIHKKPKGSVFCWRERQKQKPQKGAIGAI